MFCVEVRVLETKSTERLVSQHLSAMPLSEWILSLGQVAFTTALVVIVSVPTGDFPSFLFLLLLTCAFLLFPCIFICITSRFSLYS